MSLYSIARSALWGLSAFPGNRYKRFLAESQQWTRDQVLDYRNAKLRRLVTHCYMNVPHYRKEMECRRMTPSDIKSAEDLWKLPVLTKDVIRNEARELLARQFAPAKRSWSKTGGTTGVPVRVAKDRECQVWEAMYIERGLEWGGLTFDEPRVRVFGGSLGLGRPRLSARVGKLLRPDVFVPAFELRSDTARRFIGQIQRSGLRFAIGYASALYSLAVLARAIGEKLRFEAVFPTAELLLRDWEVTIHETFECAVLPYYGCGEINGLGFSRVEEGGYHVPDEHAVIEAVNDSGEADLDGDGRFLITDLDNYAMPLLRYENGDAGKLSGPAGGSPFSRIERLDGRYNAFLMTDEGFLISGVIGTHVFREIASVSAYRIIQEEPLRIVIKIVPTPEYTEADEGLVVDLFKRHLGQRMRIDIERVPSIPPPPSGKAVFVINRCLDAAKGLSGPRGAVSA